MPGVQRLRFFLSESPWEAEQVNDRRLELLREQPATAPHEGGVIVIDDSGDRKDGTATANVGRQWLGRLGKTDNGIVTVTPRCGPTAACTTRSTRRPTPPPITSPAAAPTRPSARNRSCPLPWRPAGRRR